MIRVLVADDSPTVRALLVGILQEDPELLVVGEACDGPSAVELAVRLRPDVITMDVQMPGLDGLEATKEIMARAPARILIVSSSANEREMELSLDATQAGALMVMTPPDEPAAPTFEENRAQFIAMVKAMASVKVVRRWATPTRMLDAPRLPLGPLAEPPRPARLVAITASTGGPAALQRVLMDLPRNFPAPILVVQHIAPGFVPGLCAWLSGRCGLRVRVAGDRERLESRTVYLAPDDAHLGVRPDGTALLDHSAPIGGFRPSATFLFESLAQRYGSSAVAVILTGMGRDGVDGLRAVHRAGGQVIAQDEATSVVYGMPREAALAGVVNAVLPVERIAERLIALTRGLYHAPLDPDR
ncbi:MAG TPA: chemotaxis-specific protein-glutamate methyltransferase CheB [Gemmatimonadales bacterium]|nr:chemotaxis-specific protein-glutamate methyltransferase CheB [Gemmatimonadales bacterium]